MLSKSHKISAKEKARAYQFTTKKITLQQRVQCVFSQHSAKTIKTKKIQYNSCQGQYRELQILIVKSLGLPGITLPSVFKLHSTYLHIVNWLRVNFQEVCVSLYVNLHVIKHWYDKVCQRLYLKNMTIQIMLFTSMFVQVR